MREVFFFFIVSREREGRKHHCGFSSLMLMMMMMMVVVYIYIYRASFIFSQKGGQFSWGVFFFFRRRFFFLDGAKKMGRSGV